jgi:hypothetical protein
MMKLTGLILVLLLSGCSLIPSKWDVNQARVVTNISFDIGQLDCSKDPTETLTAISNDLIWLHTYNTYKGTSDLDHMTSVVQKTVSEFQANVAAKKSNVVYCQLKKALIIQQTDIIGHTFEGSLP